MVLLFHSAISGIKSEVILYLFFSWEMISKDLFDLDILCCVVSYEFDKLTEFCCFYFSSSESLKEAGNELFIGPS